MKFHSDRFIPPRHEHTVWVFPTDTAGRHKCGPAVIAHKNFKARYGVGRGLTGSAYAIAAFDKGLQPLPKAAVVEQIDEFLTYAKSQSQSLFVVARFELQHENYSEKDIALLFAQAPQNCSLPQSWAQHFSKPSQVT